MVITSPLAPVLPTELWINIFNKLDINSCYKFSEVSKDFRKIGNDLNYWNRFLEPEYRETSDGNRAKITFITNLAARNSIGLALDMAGYLYSRIESLKQYDPIQYQQDIKEGLESLIGMGSVRPKLAIDIEKSVFNHQEINSSLDGDHLSQIGKFRKEAALTIFNREHLLEKINGRNLLEIAIHYQADREIIINILTREELYQKFDENNVLDIAEAYGKTDKLAAVELPGVPITVERLVDILRKHLIPPVVPDDYKYSVDIEAIVNRA
ncbi:F-box protein [Mycoavidus sp. B2-EB]|uniref:F-box protein n=1 Tax=Mycoavidus sp. B2-EB TaxID=2651972 RepID=UPI00162504A8|nr:F-box protein [Mycoavidus sp. B2-EB]BBO59350.1 hypothetical protein MPB2EB_0466 [Mycoavidus sp. B2-EB]